MGLTPYLAVLKSFELNLRTEKMAACNFRRGLILFNLQRQMAMSQKNATFSTSTVILGGGHAPSKYELHGGEKQKLPIGLEIGKLREKEKGDWKKMTIEEKRVLYRASFCSTLAEMTAPTGEWKRVAGYVLIALGISLWMVIWTQKFVIPGGLRTLEPQYIKANIQKRIDMEMGPIEGVASQYDYEKNQWKK